MCVLLDLNHIDRDGSIFNMENEKIFAFETHFGGSGATYTVDRRLIGKLIIDFLLFVIELFFRYVLSFCHTFDGHRDGWTDTPIFSLHTNIV